VALLWFLLCAVVPAAALDFPALSGRVVDEAGILDQPAREALAAKLADLEAKTTHQLVVVTLKSLQGTSIEDFGVQLGRRWQIGQKDKNNGVLLIVAPNERKVRIEVGYGLEGALTDALSRVIIENAIIPRFRANDIPGGIARGVDDLIQVLEGDQSWQQRITRRPEPPSNWFPLLVVLVVFGVFGLAVMLVIRDMRHPPRSGHGWTSGATPYGSSWGSGSSGGFSGGSSGGFSGGGGSFGGGGASGSW
jgi:uncharacterized protein